MSIGFQVIPVREKELSGVPVGRVLPHVKQRSLGPFVFLDHMGGPNFESSEGLVVLPHPHIGLSTLTYLFQGRIRHRDSLGNDIEIVPGEVNWMTAGSGVAHSERAMPNAGARFRLDGLQFWVALPKEQEDIPASFLHLSAAEIPKSKVENLSMTLVAGEFHGQRSPLQTTGQLLFADLTATSSGSIQFSHSAYELGIYLVQGNGELRGEKYGPRELLSFAPGEAIDFSYSADARFMLLGGLPLPEPRFMWWNFVSTSQEKIEAAKMRWSAREFPPVPGENELVPLPKN